MPPEVLAFFNATGRFPTAQDGLQPQAQAFGPPPQVGVPTFLGQGGGFQPGGGLGGLQPSQGASPQIQFDPTSAPVQQLRQNAPQSQQLNVDREQLPPPQINLQPPQLGPVGPVGPALAPSAINLPDIISRARLGGGSGPSAGGGAASFPRAGFGGLGGVGAPAGTGAGSAITASGLQQQADVAQQRQLAASSLNSLIGGVGSFG